MNTPVDEAQVKQDNEKKIDDFVVNQFMVSIGFIWDGERQWWYNEDNVHMYQRAAANMFNKISLYLQARESHKGSESATFKGTGEGETYKKAIQLIAHPVEYSSHGTYIFGADDLMIADVRGWGWIQKLKNPEQTQDEIGRFIAEAINEKLTVLTNKDYQS